MGREIVSADLVNRLVERATRVRGVPRGSRDVHAGLRGEGEPAFRRGDPRPGARLRAADRAQLCWTLGSPSTTTRDNVLALINLAPSDRPRGGATGSGLNPLRGRNNVRGAATWGRSPNKLRAGRTYEDAVLRAKFEKVYGARIPAKKACTCPDVRSHGARHAADGVLLGENPAQSEADMTRAMRLMEGLDQPGRAASS